MRHNRIVNFEDTQENHCAFNRIKHQLSQCSQGHCAFNTILFLFTLTNLNLKFTSQNVVIGYKQLNLLFSICKTKAVAWCETVEPTPAKDQPPEQIKKKKACLGLRLILE